MGFRGVVRKGSELLWFWRGCVSPFEYDDFVEAGLFFPACFEEAVGVVAFGFEGGEVEERVSEEARAELELGHRPVEHEVAAVHMPSIVEQESRGVCL